MPISPKSVLSPKLQLIYENLLPGEDLWDLCCDHGYLGQVALASNEFNQVFFVDQVPHIIEKLEARLRKESPKSFDLDASEPSEVEASLIKQTYLLSRKAHFRNVPAELLQESLFGNVVIAGVGAYTAFAIVKSLWERQFLQAKRLILSPQRDDEKFLRWLSEMDDNFNHRYQLKSQQSVREGRRPLWVYVCGE